MSFAEFIRANSEAILSEWEEFARTLTPAASDLDARQLRDFGKRVLEAIAKDMAHEQSEEERAQKSRGNRPEHAPPVAESAKQHASDRLTQGFSLDQMVAEYRALRASVVRGWMRDVATVSRSELDELTRFNEAVDQSLSNAIRWYTARLEEARDLFVGALGHDLRNPLAAILTSVEVQLQTDHLDPIQVETAMRMRNSALRMQEMLADLLDFTRTRLGEGIPLTLAPAHLGEVAEPVIEELRALHADREVRLELSGDLNGEWDRVRLQQLLSNLVGNAIRHCRPGSPVTVTVRGDTDTVELAVSNEGEPIPFELQRVMFAPLQRGAVSAERPSREDGLGLGLFIARQVAEAHGGSVELSSSDQKGTAFTVRLPRHPEKGSESAGVT
jgi:signal transduction histidine kinase